MRILVVYELTFWDFWTTDRLLAFYTVETNYLNIFLMLGALGLLFGILGLGILIFRMTFEQIPEFALLLSLRSPF